MRIEIPMWLLNARFLEEFIHWLKGLAVEREIDRKEILCDWCNMTGYPLTKELVDRVYSGPG